MKSFNFKSATNTKEAAKLASGRATFLAGGMTLLPAIKLRLAAYSDLINIKKIKGLSGIKVSSKSLRIGATTTHAEVAASKEVGKSIPSLAVLAEGIGDPQVRNRGTIGGSISNNDPTADYPCACLSLKAKIKTNKREISAEDFFVGLFETALEENEIVISIEFCVPQKASYMKFPNPASRYAMAGVYVAVFHDGINVSVTGASENGVFKWTEMEEALSSELTIEKAKSIKLSSDGVMSDIHADSAYRANLVDVMAVRAVKNLI